MKERLQKLKTKCHDKYWEFALASATAVAQVPKMTLAAGEATQKVVEILEVLIDIFPAIGIVIALVGAFKLFMAFRNDQPDAYSGAAKDIVVGVVLVVFKLAIWPVIKGLV